MPDKTIIHNPVLRVGGVDYEVTDFGSATLSPTSDQKDALDGNAGLNAANPVASQQDITDAVVGLYDDRGNYDASGNVFPSTGGSGTAGAILKGDIWTISVVGTLGGNAVSLGDTVRALQDTPGQTASNWAVSEANIGYVPENTANKVTTLSGSSTDQQYPSAKAVYDQFQRKQPAGTGWLCPPELSINGGDNTKFDISAGTGVIYNYDCTSPSYTIIQYAGATAVTPTYLATNVSSNIVIDVTGTLTQQDSLPSDQERRVGLYVGVVLHVNLTIINAVQNEPIVLDDDSQTIRDLCLAIGVINKSGNVFSANGANLNINKSAGEFFRIFANYSTAPTAPNKVSSNALTPASFLRGYYNGSTWVYDASPTSTVPVTQYNNTASGLVAVSPNKFIIHNIYIFPGTDQVLLHYGQAQYDTLDQATAGLTNATVGDPNISDSSLRCRLIVKTNATDLSSATDAKFVEMDKFGQSGTGGGGSVGSGEANTISSVGTGVSVVFGKSGVDLQLKSLTSTDSSIARTADTNTVDLKLNVNGITAGTTLAVDDEFAMYDTSEMVNRKMTVGYMRQDIPNLQTGTTYQLALTDPGKTVYASNASPFTVTIPANATTAIPVNSVIPIFAEGAGTVTITAASGVSLNGVTAGTVDISGQYKAVQLIKRGTDSWIIIGSLNGDVS